MSCFFARYSKRKCDGPIDRCHLIPKQRIRRELAGAMRSISPELANEIVWHPSVLVEGCRRHHGDFDARQLRVPRQDLPPGVEEYAEAFELVWSLDHDYGLRDKETA